jgi:predicted flap endonuclease-1-like 5' DNA nuclease
VTVRLDERAFGRPEALPQDAKPVTSWTNRDEAFKNVCDGIRKTTDELTSFSATFSPTTSSRPTKPDRTPTKEVRGQWVIVLSATIDEVDKPLAEALLGHLRRLSGDAQLTLQRIESGSVIVVLEGSHHGYKRVKSLLASGQLTTVVGINIEKVEWRFATLEQQEGIPIGRIKGISVKYAQTLRQHRLNSSTRYLDATRTAEMRRELAKKLGISERMVLEHANRCDLARIDGIGRVYSNLLENAGVDTIKELATRTPENLLTKLAETNIGNKYSRRNPTLKEVKSWVTQAKLMPKMLEY